MPPKVTCFLPCLLYIIFPVSDCCCYENQSSLILVLGHWYWSWEVVTYASICLHSSILVLSSPKLRKVLKTMLWKALDKGWSVSS